MKILTEVNQDQYLWQRIMLQWRIKLVRQPRMKVSRMQLKKTVDARRNLISKLKEKKDSSFTKKTATENRMLALGNEELQLKKKRMID